MIHQIRYDDVDEGGICRLAKALHEVLPMRMTVVLTGMLGAGKTRFVQAFAEACGIDAQDVTSPTFVLCQHYEGERRIHHVDAYRMNSVNEFIDWGGMELFSDNAVVFVEWGERLQDALPAERLEIRLDVVDPILRTVTVGTESEDLFPLLRKMTRCTR